MISNRSRYRVVLLSFMVAGLMLTASPRRARAETLVDLKTLYYIEDGNRIEVIAPMAAFQTETGDGLTIRLEGIYNSISGATPTGAPLVGGTKSASVAPVVIVKKPKPVIPDDGGDDDGGEDQEENDKGNRVRRPATINALSSHSPVSAQAFNSLSGATPPVPPVPPTPTPTPGKKGTTVPVTPTPASTGGKLPVANFEDTREAATLDLSYRMGRHTPGIALSYSQESDYLSRGVALKDAIDFNKKNTTLLVGVAGTFDDVRPANGLPDDTKTTYDLMVGVTQVLDPLTLLTINGTIGRTEGFLSDPYKVVEMNGALAQEKRPDSRDKQILFGSLVRYVEALDGSLESSYRFYNDSFGVQAHTLTLAWYQKLGPQWMVRPLLRYYTQSEADFYAVRFTGSPHYYSSDYRNSQMSSLGGGLKVIWTPNSRISLDVAYERYEQWGLDNVTPDELYPSANIIMVGLRLWF